MSEISGGDGEWLTGNDPEEMLEWLRDRGLLTERKSRLFAVACVRRVWPLLDERSRQAVGVAERLAEGEVSVADLARAEEEAEVVYESTRPASEEARERNCDLAQRGITGHTGGEAIAVSCAALAVAGACRGDAAEAAGQAAYGVTMAVLSATAPLDVGKAEWDAYWSAANAANATVLRDVFGPLPFRQVYLDRAWRTPAVLALANAIYEGCRFEDMPVLADALEEAGCGDPEVLQHLREQGKVHVRGCWCLDLLLRKEEQGP